MQIDQAELKDQALSVQLCRRSNMIDISTEIINSSCSQANTVKTLK